MKRLRIKDPNSNQNQFFEDIERIGRIMFFEGYWSTPDECQQLWELVSDTVCASWLILPEDDNDVMLAMRPFIDDD